MSARQNIKYIREPPIDEKEDKKNHDTKSTTS